MLAPFVGVRRHDVNGLNSEGVGGSKRRGDVAEIAEAFHDETDGVAPVPNGVPEPLLPGIGDAGRDGVDDVGAGDDAAVPAPESVQVREPPSLRFGKEEWLPFHLHERGDSFGIGAR